MSDPKHIHAKIECLHFDTKDVRLVITERYGKQEIRMHGEDAKFIVEAIAASKRRTQPEATKPAQDDDDEDTWRRLALQFDGHRMMALGHLRAMLQDAQKHAPLVEAFLKAPPMDGEAVLAQRIAALASPADALVAGDRVDAERYRWLREKRDIPPGARNLPWVVALDPEQKIHTMVQRAEIDLDHAIDAAILQSQGGKNG